MWRKHVHINAIFAPKTQMCTQNLYTQNWEPFNSTPTPLHPKFIASQIDTLIINIVGIMKVSKYILPMRFFHLVDIIVIL
jgi:hypothetical protein